MWSPGWILYYICTQNTNFVAKQHNVPRSLDIYGFLFFITNIDDIIGKRRYGWNMLHWSKNDFKSKKSTNGDYFFTIFLQKFVSFIFE